jgi:hypothetical protein
MKIRTDFVSNSSSTSFVIISKSEIDESKFLNLMGVTKGSPMESLFTALFNLLQYNMFPVKKYFDIYNRGNADWFESLKSKFSEEIAKRITDAEDKGYKVFVGNLDSDEGGIESFFCTDSFEVESEDIYFNALECYW